MSLRPRLAFIAKPSSRVRSQGQRRSVGFCTALRVQNLYPLAPYRNAGMTSLANSRIDFLIMSCGMPPKLNVLVMILKL